MGNFLSSCATYSISYSMNSLNVWRPAWSSGYALESPGWWSKERARSVPDAIVQRYGGG